MKMRLKKWQEEMIENIVGLLKKCNIHENKEVEFLTPINASSNLSPKDMLRISLSYVNVVENSPALYNQIYQEGLLTHQTEGRLKQLSS